MQSVWSLLFKSRGINPSLRVNISSCALEIVFILAYSPFNPEIESPFKGAGHPHIQNIYFSSSMLFLCLNSLGVGCSFLGMSAVEMSTLSPLLWI